MPCEGRPPVQGAREGEEDFMTALQMEILTLYRQASPELKKEFMSLVKAMAEQKPVPVRREARHEQG